MDVIWLFKTTHQQYELIKSLNKCCKRQGNPGENPNGVCKTPETWETIYLPASQSTKPELLKNNNVNVLKRPTQSPGLNPVENL